jgi:plastocyanin
MSRPVLSRSGPRGISSAQRPACGVTLCALLLLGGGAWASAVRSADLAVRVVDPKGRGVEGIVIVAEPDHAHRDHSAVRTATMDQRQMQFVPQILVLQTGSSVEFPNSDQIEHQVYSLSPAKRFELSLYRGHKYPPVVFDQAGLVTLGCNIHDFMIGWIFVTDSPYFARTRSDGSVELHALPAGGYTLIAWHPRLSERSGTSVRRHIEVPATGQAMQLITLEHELRRDMTRMGQHRWADY